MVGRAVTTSGRFELADGLVAELAGEVQRRAARRPVRPKMEVMPVE